MEPKGSYERGYKDGYAKNVFDRERLTVELEQADEQFREENETYQAMKKNAEIYQERAESAKAKNLEPAARVATMEEALQDIVDRNEI